MNTLRCHIKAKHKNCYVDTICVQIIPKLTGDVTPWMTNICKDKTEEMFHHQWHRTCSPITTQFKCLFLYDCVNILLGMTFISHPFIVNIYKDNPWSPCTISEMRNRFSVILLLPLFSESCRNCQQGIYFSFIFYISCKYHRVIIYIFLLLFNIINREQRQIINNSTFYMNRPLITRPKRALYHNDHVSVAY